MLYQIDAPSSLTNCEADFIQHVLQVPRRARVVINMENTGFMKPHDCMLLLLSTRQIYLRTGHRVELVNMRSDLHNYLHRIDMFVKGVEWVFTRQSLQGAWSRNPDSLYVMQLERVATAADVQNKAVPKVRSIVEMWLGKSRQTDDVVTVVAELCQNAWEHSGKEGYVMVQKYAPLGFIDIHIAVGDLGKGIRTALLGEHQALKGSDSKFIERAIQGWTSRKTGRGGDGLPTVDSCVRSEGSSLFIRSGTGAVHRSAGRSDVRDHLPNLPGTRAAVVLRATA